MAETVSGMFQQVVGKFGGRPAFRYRAGEGFATITFSELAARVEALATALLDLGVTPGQKLGLISDNRPEWILCDLACISIGVPDVPRGSDSTAREIEYILGHAEASGAFVEDARRLERIAPLRERLPGLRFLVVMDPDWSGPATEGVHSLADLVERGRVLRAGGDRRLEAARAAIRPDDIATIIYTSGTTGEPKGVVLSHRNLMQNTNVLPGLMQMTHEDLFISLLPPWHIFERQVEYSAIAAGACQSYSCIRTLGADMASEKPTFMASVPRVWEGILGRVTANIAKEPAAKQRIFGLLLRVSKRYVLASKVLQGRDTLYSKPSPAARLAHGAARPDDRGAARAGVRLRPEEVRGDPRCAPAAGCARRSRAAGRCRPTSTSSSPRSASRCSKAYGLTETSPALAARTFDRQVLGTVGPPIPGTEIRIVDEQGRDLPQGQKGIVLCRGAQVMVGYYKRPEETAKVLSADGWFNTGDLGRMTIRGELSLTGRAKETIVLLGGENIEPPADRGRPQGEPVSSRRSWSSGRTRSTSGR